MSRLDQLIAEMEQLVAMGLGDDNRLELANRIYKLARAVMGSDDPVAAIQWIPAEQVKANDYNPNSVAPPEMKLLRESIKADGVTQPVVVYPEGNNQYTVVDGFHRSKVLRQSQFAEKRGGLIPCVILTKGRADRIASTIRHNRARGKHSVQGESENVAELKKAGLTDAEIMQALGMDADKVLRLQQISGMAELFASEPLSEAWE